MSPTSVCEAAPPPGGIGGIVEPRGKLSSPWPRIGRDMSQKVTGSVADRRLQASLSKISVFGTPVSSYFPLLGAKPGNNDTLRENK